MSELTHECFDVDGVRVHGDPGHDWSDDDREALGAVVDAARRKLTEETAMVSVDLSEDSVRALRLAARAVMQGTPMPPGHGPALASALSVLSEAVPRRTAIVGKGDTAEDGWEPWMARPDGA